MEYFYLSSTSRFSRLYQLSHCCSLASLERRIWSRGIHVTPLLEMHEHIRKRGETKSMMKCRVGHHYGHLASLHYGAIWEALCIYPSSMRHSSKWFPQSPVPTSHQVYSWKVHVEPSFCQCCTGGWALPLQKGSLRGGCTKCERIKVVYKKYSEEPVLT